MSRKSILSVIACIGAAMYGVVSYAIDSITVGPPIVGAGKVVILDNVSAPNAAQMYNSLNVVNSAITVTLPTGVAGMFGCVIDSGTAHDIIVDIQALDTIALTGAADSAGDGITNASGSSTGDFACVVATADNTWRVLQRQGTWTQQ